MAYLLLIYASKSGLCAFAPNSEACYLAIPASTSKGSALVYKASDPELICQVLGFHNCSSSLSCFLTVLVCVCVLWADR
jgi:hypothetical protein